MKKNKSNILVSLLFIALLILTASISQVEAQSHSWTFASIGSEGSFRHVTIERFNEVIQEKTDGDVEIRYFLDGALGSAQESIETLQAGGIDLQIAAPSALGAIVPGYQAISLPFIVNDREEAFAALDGPFGGRIKELAEKENIKILGFTDIGFTQITNNVRPINSPDDFSGMTMRTSPAPHYVEQFREMGASVSTMPFGEVYLALDQGVIDGQFNPLNSIRSQSFYEVQDYLAITNNVFFAGAILMNLDLWESLDEGLQEQIMKATAEAEIAGRAFAEEEFDDSIEYLEQHFEEITYPDLEPFIEAMQPIYENMGDEFGEDNIQLLIDFLEEYRNE